MLRLRASLAVSLESKLMLMRDFVVGDGDLGTVAGGNAGAANAAGAAADDEEVEVVGHLLGSFRKARALPSTRWGRRPQTPLHKIVHDL